MEGGVGRSVFGMDLSHIRAVLFRMEVCVTNCGIICSVLGLSSICGSVLGRFSCTSLPWHTKVSGVCLAQEYGSRKKQPAGSGDFLHAGHWIACRIAYLNAFFTHVCLSEWRHRLFASGSFTDRVYSPLSRDGCMNSRRLLATLDN